MLFSVPTYIIFRAAQSGLPTVAEGGHVKS